MPRNTRFQFVQEDPEVRRLRNELFFARRTIVSLMAPVFREILDSYHGYKSTEETRGWVDRVAAAIIELTEPVPVDSSPFSRTRANCPLCGDGSSSPYADGFLLPEGLRRHLLGWGNARRCEVLEAAYALAHESWHDRFATIDAAAAAAERATLDARRSTEQLYRIDPDGSPKLLDEFLGYGESSRTPERLSWAAKRLLDLGFDAVSEGNVLSYVERLADAIVYADVRREGQIAFAAYPMRKVKGTRLVPRYAPFHLMDSWKNDLTGKYRSRRDDALRSLGLL